MPRFAGPKLGLYQHYKGGLYIVIGTAKHTETGAHLVIYRTLNDHPLTFWARPFSEWEELVNGRFRFTRIEKEDDVHVMNDAGNLV